MSTTTKKDLILRIADQTGLTQVSVKRTIQCFLEIVMKDLSAGRRLELREFGVFEVQERRPRRAQNPQTLEPLHVPAKKVVKFKLGRLMRECLESENADSFTFKYNDDEVVEIMSDLDGQAVRRKSARAPSNVDG